MNYNSLYTTVIDYLARDDISETIFNVWLRTIESELNSKLTTWNEYVEFSGVLKDNRVELPDDYKQGIVTKIGDSLVRVLQYKQPQFFEETRDVYGYYTMKNNELVVSGGYPETEITIDYNRKIVPLSKTKPENYISKEYSGLYLYGLLREAYNWVQDYEKSEQNNLRYREIIDDVNYQGVMKSASGSQLVIRTDRI